MRSISGSQLARVLGPWRGVDVAGPERRSPAYTRLAETLRLLVLDGALPLGTRLPGERELAAALGVSRTTVAGAYDALRASGLAGSRQGSGTWTAVPGGLDLARAAPSAPGALHEAYEAALTALPRLLPGHGYEPIGLPELRAAVADRFSARGLPTVPEEVLVTGGAQQAWSLVLALLVGPGDRVLVEQPTYPSALDAARRAGARLVPVPLTSDGWDVDGLAAALRQTAPRLAYLLPDFQNPTGLLMTTPVREAVARHLAATRTPAVVDETNVDLALDGVTVPPPLAAHAPASMLTIGSASKMFWGGLGIGWIRAERATIRRLAGVRATLDHGTPVVEQLAATHLLCVADAVLADRRRELATRRDALRAALARRLPAWRPNRPSGGLVLWCRLDAQGSTALVSAAQRRGVRLAAGPRFGVDGAFENWLRLPFTLPVPDLETAVDALAPAWAAVTHGRPRVVGGDEPRKEPEIPAAVSVLA